MLWFSIWFLVILKIPIVYLGYVIWWALKDPPEPSSGLGYGPAQNGHGGGGQPTTARSLLPRRPIPGRRPGPHGVPVRRPVPARARRRVTAP
jgi:hypothetical protein